MDDILHNTWRHIPKAVYMLPGDHLICGSFEQMISYMKELREKGYIFRQSSSPMELIIIGKEGVFDDED